MSNSKLIKIKTDKKKFVKQYATILKRLMFGDLSTEEGDVLVCLYNSSEDKDSFTSVDKEACVIEMKKIGYSKFDIKSVEKCLKVLRKKKYINRNKFRPGLFPMLEKDFKLMFYFYE